MTLKIARLSLISLSIAALAAGCAKTAQPKPLTPQSFAAPRPGPVNGGAEVGERTSPAMEIRTDNTGNTNPRPIVPPISIVPLTGGNPPADVPKTGVSDVVANEIKPVLPATAGSNAGGSKVGNTATRPASAGAGTTTQPLGPSSGQYLTLGGVVAEVNTTPIFANKVIKLIDAPLRERAKQLDINGFRRAAMDDIVKTVRELVQVELEYAAAQRSLDDEEKQMAKVQTMVWRLQQITRAGGSLEIAKRKAKEDTGLEFDELVDEQSRTEMVRLYYQKKVYPRIQVTAADIREYYDKNYDKEFTDNEKVSFRLLKVDIAKTGSKDAAITKVAEKHKRAKAGEDFKEMVLKENDEKMFATEKPWEMAPASFAVVKVREALKTLQPGQLSEIIEDRGAFYIVKLDSRQGGVVHAFDDQKVQDAIRVKLRTAQLRVLRDQERIKLTKGAMIRMDEPMMNIALEMAMQKYAQYAAAK